MLFTCSMNVLLLNGSIFSHNCSRLTLNSLPQLCHLDSTMGKCMVLPRVLQFSGSLDFVWDIATAHSFLFQPFC